MAVKEQDLVCGFHAVTSALRLHPEQIRELWMEKSRKDERSQLVLSIAHARNIVVHMVKPNTLDNMLGHEHHQGVAAHYVGGGLLKEDDLQALLAKDRPNQLFVILDGIQDPHNLGACLRCADAAGASGLIIPKDRAVSVTATVRKVASGAAESVAVFQVTNLARTMALMKKHGIWLIGLAGNADRSLYEVDLKGNIAVVMGAEKGGLRRLTVDNCDIIANLPMQGQVQSLNVSVATGICLYEVVRQRQFAKI